MNSVQTNIMNIAPAPNAAAKTTNAAEAVRPTSQTGATAERGAKNPSFDKALAKLKTAKQDVADMAEAVAKDPLAASLAASGQTQAKPADAADGESPAEAVQGVQTVEESAPVQVSAKNDAGQMPVVSLEIPAVLAQETDEPVLMTSPTDEAAAQEVNELPAQEAPLVSSHKAGDSAAKPSVQPQGNPAGVDNLAALLVRSEKSAQDLLQALSGRTLPQASQSALLAAAEQLPQPDAGAIASEVVNGSLQTDMNLMANVEVENETFLPDALLRALAQQPAVPAAASLKDGLRQNAEPMPLDKTATPLSAATVDVKVLSPQASGTAMNEQGLTQDDPREGFAGLFGEQQEPQSQKPAVNSLFSSLTSAQPLDEGAAKPKAGSAMQVFTEAAQTQQGAHEANHVPQANPGVAFQTALHEAAEAQPTAPTAAQKDYEVARQIVEQARLLRMPEQTEMVIRLKPEHLGELTLKVSVAANGAVNAAFHTDNAAVRTIIETSMIQLKQELQAQGLKVDNVGVYAGLSDSSLMNGQQDANAYYAQGGQGSRQGRDAQQALASFEEEQQALGADAQQGVLAQDGVDYRI